MSRKKSALGIFIGLGSRIRKIRGTLTQVKFAASLGIAQGTVNKYEKGTILPGEDVLNKIAKYGGVTVEWLLHGEGVPAQQLLEVTPDRLPDEPLRPLETGLIIQVATLIEETLKARRLKLHPDQKGRLIGLLYEYCRENREPPTRHLVEKYLLLAE